jgi:hypothetical protein
VFSLRTRMPRRSTVMPTSTTLSFNRSTQHYSPELSSVAVEQFFH